MARIELLALDGDAIGTVCADVLGEGSDVRARLLHFHIGVVAEPDGRVPRAADARAVAGTGTCLARSLRVPLQVVDAILQPAGLHPVLAAYPADDVVLLCSCAWVEALRSIVVLIPLSKYTYYCSMNVEGTFSKVDIKRHREVWGDRYEKVYTVAWLYIPCYGEREI